MALVGAFAHGATIAPARLRDALVAAVRAHWGAGWRALSEISLPGAGAHTRERFAALQRAAAGADVAAALLEPCTERTCATCCRPCELRRWSSTAAGTARCRSPPAARWLHCFPMRGWWL